MTARHYCPECGGGLVSNPVNAPFRCKNCDWRLITRAEWQTLSPFHRGYTLYMQSAWPTSELNGEKNPYGEGTAEWAAFRQGEQRAALDAQDGEE